MAMATPAGTPALNRRDRRRLELYERILEAAHELFQDKGFEETKVTEICERADVAYGTFFNHFPNKADLLTALADRAILDISERLEALSKQKGSVEDLLIELFQGDAEAFQAMTPQQRELLGRVQALAFSDAPNERDRRFHAAFESFLARGVEDGRVRSDVPVETLGDVVAATYASMSLTWMHIDDFPVRARASSAARFLASTLAP